MHGDIDQVVPVSALLEANIFLKKINIKFIQKYLKSVNIEYLM